MTSGIYAIIVNDKFYIGSSKKIEYRFKEHKSRLKCQNHDNIYLQNLYNKYGIESFRFKILEEVDNIETLLEIEQDYIDFSNKEYLINLCLSTRSGPITNEIEYTFVSPKGEIFTGSNIEEFCRQHKLTAPTMRCVHYGKYFQSNGWTNSLKNHKKWFGLPRNQPITLFSKDFPEGKTFNTPSHAAKSLSIHSKDIYRMLKGLQNRVSKYYLSQENYLQNAS